MHIKNKRGQSTVEYILLVTAVIAVMVVLLTNQNSGIQQQLNTTLNFVISDIGTQQTALSGSRSYGNAANSTSAPAAPYSVDVANGVGG